jgi:lysophospholipase L1-like esterase
MNAPARPCSVACLLLALFVASAIPRGAAQTPLDGRRVLVMGDSITQDGKYVSFLEYYLHRLSPGASPDLISIGLGSETVSGLSEPGHPFPRPNALDRLGAALKAVKPQVVMACYGMNDGIYHPPAPERLAAFEAGLDRLIREVRATGADLVLVTSPVFDPVPIPQRLAAEDAKEHGYRAVYPKYNDVLAELAAAGRARRGPGVRVIDLHTRMAEALAESRRTSGRAAFTFAPDGVHPNEAGHLLMARILAEGLGLRLPQGIVDTELARIRSDPLFDLVRERRELRSEAWLPFVGYTRGPTFKSEHVRAAEAVVARLGGLIEAAKREAAP